MKCPQCFTENGPEARFCKHCATPLVQTAPPAPETPTAPYAPPAPPPPPRPRQEPFQPIVGLLAFAFFLVGVAVLFAVDPNAFGDLTTWSQSARTYNTIFVRPPDPFILGWAWFFAVVGALEFVSAALRYSLRWTHLRVLGRILSGLGDLVFAVLLFQYADRAISGGGVITALVGLFAGLLMIYVVMAFYWASARPYPPRHAGEPWVRP